MTKIAKKSFVDKIVSELMEFVRYLIGVRSKADKKLLREEMAADKSELEDTVASNKADANSKISAAIKHIAACEAMERELDGLREEDENTIAHALGALRQTLETEEDGTIKFKDTNYLDDATTIKEALIILDREIANI
ncbi:MAG: hypothetical protein IJ640_00300 [Prevotella sp.]|nr:hypothetical protein [Prevotella sp.]